MRFKTVIRQGSFSRRVGHALNGLPTKVVAEERVTTFNLELDGYREAFQIEEHRASGRTCRELACGWVIVSGVGGVQV